MAVMAVDDDVMNIRQVLGDAVGEVHDFGGRDIVLLPLSLFSDIDKGVVGITMLPAVDLTGFHILYGIGVDQRSIVGTTDINMLLLVSSDKKGRFIYLLPPLISGQIGWILNTT